MKRQVVIIGGGASGMMAAIQAARAGAEVTVLEHMDRVGKKILSTGNGRCNLTNRYQTPECYRCSQKEFPQQALARFSLDDTLDFFQNLGILLKDRNGYLYPNSDQASTVLDMLRMELEHLGVHVWVNCQVKSVKKQGRQFVIETDQEKGRLQADAVIVAAGSKAAPVTGSDGSGYELAKSLGHRIVTPLPALVQLRCKEKHYKQLAGIRTDVEIRLMVKRPENGEKAVDVRKQMQADRGHKGKTEAGKNRGEIWETAASEKGELQLTDYGISGIPTFQISRFASIALNKGYQVKAVIDFLPQMELWETDKMMKQRCQQMSYKTAEDWMVGLLNKKLSLVLLKLAGIGPQQKVAEVPKAKWKELLKWMKSYETMIVSVNPYENAQVCCGGVDTREVAAETMESRKVPGLYFAGEILDVDGICGGYNLQWAWSSGAVAGRCAAGI